MEQNALTGRARFDAAAEHWDTETRKARADKLCRLLLSRIPRGEHLIGMDLGAGTGLISFGISDRFSELYCVDDSPGMLRTLSEKRALLSRENVIPADMSFLHDPACRGRFDAVVSSMTFHHIRDVRGELLLVRRLLTDGGKLYLIDLDTVSPAFHKSDPGFDGHHGFDRAALAALARACGFSRVTFENAYAGIDHEVDEDVPYTLFLMEATAEKENA